MTDTIKIPHTFWSRQDTRRGFLREMGIGSAAGLVSAAGITGCGKRQIVSGGLASSVPVTAPDSTVSFSAGGERRELLYRALEPFRDELAAAIADRQVIIKINCVGQNGHPLMVTHPDAVRAMLDFLRPIYSREVIIAESTVQNKNPEKTFDIFGYRPLEKEYNARIVELNDAPTDYCWILDQNLYPRRIRIVRPLLDRQNYVISLTRFKTHNAVVATLSLKNVVMGSPLKIPREKINEKAKMHGGFAGTRSPKLINLNLFLMAHRVRPDFAILDGFEGVEGNGPAHGDPVDHRVAVAGFDFLSVDRLGAELMGVPWDYIGYLNYCAEAGLGQADLSRIKVVGGDWRGHIRKYRLHDTIESQLKWKDDLVFQNKDS